jgi:hypothetical protein
MFTFVRRSAAAVLISAALIVPALAQDWREQYPELTIGISSGENDRRALPATSPMPTTSAASWACRSRSCAAPTMLP